MVVLTEQDESLKIKALLEDVRDYLRSNIPGDSWGLRDRGADADREALLVRVRAALEPAPTAPREAATSAELMATKAWKRGVAMGAFPAPTENTGAKGLDTWRKWFKDSGNAEFWNNIECIECELGRECSNHPTGTTPTSEEKDE